MPEASAVTTISFRNSVPIWWPRPREPQWMVATTSSCASPEDLGDGRIENLRDCLDLEIMVAGAERAHLAPLPFLGAVGDVLGLGARHLACLLDPFEVAPVPPATLDSPTGAT